MISTHKGWTTSDDSNRPEERTAMAMHRQKDLPRLGLVLDYQTPLKDVISSHAGRIDLLTYDGDTLRIMETKNVRSTEKMLKSALEGYTYLKTAGLGKLLSDFHLPATTKVRSCPFVCIDGVQHREMNRHTPHLKHLMELLDSKPFFSNKVEDHYIVKQ